MLCLWSEVADRRSVAFYPRTDPKGKRTVGEEQKGNGQNDQYTEAIRGIADPFRHDPFPSNLKEPHALSEPFQQKMGKLLGSRFEEEIGEVCTRRSELSVNIEEITECGDDVFQAQEGNSLGQPPFSAG